MPGTIVHLGATVICTHGGQATPTLVSPFVFVNGQAVTTITAPYMIAGCLFTPGSAVVPCVTGQWLVGSAFVLASGQPVVLNVSTSICTPNGTPMNVLVTQPFVSAS